MATAFATNHALASFASSRPLPNPKPSKPLKTLTLTLTLPIPPRPSARRAIKLFSSAQFPRRCSSAAVRVAETDPKTIDGDEENRTLENKSDAKVDRNDIPPMKTLIQSYKRAFLDGDEKILYETEALICAVESETNDLSVKFANITSEITSGKDEFLRLKADFENFRKQFEKYRLSFTSDIQLEVIESLLPIVDSFEKAKLQITPETEKETKLDTSYQGIYKQLVEILRSLGVGVVETVGKPFDPSIHEAVAREESQQFKAGIVSHEIQRGFVLKEQLLRPAKVKVSTGLAQTRSDSVSEKPADQPEAPSDSVESLSGTSNGS